MSDFRVTDHGSVVAFQPLTQAAKDWVAEHVQLESWQWMGAVFHVDHRPAVGLLAAIQDFDFTIN